MNNKKLFVTLLIAPLVFSACNSNTNSTNLNLKTDLPPKMEDRKEEVDKSKEVKQMKYKSQEEQANLLKKYNKVVMKTSLGDIKIKLYENSPITVNNFLNLVEADYYDGIKFHRVIDGFMIQAGDPLTKDDTKMNRWGTGGPGYAIEDEFIEGLTNAKGTISMANAGPGTGGSQFFINLVDNTNLDWDKQPLSSKHPVFGEVEEGMDVVAAIGKVKVSGSRPSTPVIIEDVELIER